MVTSRTLAQIIWCRTGDVGRAGLVGTALVAPLKRDERRASAEAAGAILLAATVSKITKRAFPRLRPDRDDTESFPSQHAAEVIAAASTMARHDVALSAFGPALLTSFSRWPARRHHPSDIAAGIGLGLASAWLVGRIARSWGA